MLIKLCAVVCAVSTFSSACFSAWMFVESRKAMAEISKTQGKYEQISQDLLKDVLAQPEKKVDFVAPTR